MPAIQYTALRSLDAGSGRVTGTSYGFDLEVQAEAQSRKIFKSLSTALDGNTETLTQRREVRFTLTVTLIGDPALAQMIEFLNSTESGEMFKFDSLGNVAAPIQPVNAKIDGSGYSITRVGNAYKTIAFTLILL